MSIEANNGERVRTKEQSIRRNYDIMKCDQATESFFDEMLREFESGAWTPFDISLQKLSDVFSDLPDVFGRIVGVMIWSAMSDAYNNTDYELSQAVVHQHTDYGSGNGWVTTKRGLLIDLTDHMVRQDLGKELRNIAATVGACLGRAKEAAIRDAFVVVREGAAYCNASVPVTVRGDDGVAFPQYTYMENWPLTLNAFPTSTPETPLPAGVLYRWKASERGGVCVN